jgi:hypothetical protein
VHRKKQDDNPNTKWPPKLVYEYAEGGSTSTLRGHIKREHLNLYTQMCKEKGWMDRIQVKTVSQASNAMSSALVWADWFDKATFHSLLTRFIIVDDQVGSLSTSTLVSALTFTYSNF